MKVFVLIGFILSFFLVLVSNAIALGPGFSGLTANADTAETVVNNPAGMARFNEPSIYGNPVIMYTKSESEIKFKNTGQKQTVDDDSFIALPGLYYLYPLDERWVVGIGPNAAMGLGATYDDKWAGRYLLKEWSLNFVGVAPSVSYRFSNNLSVGASLPIMYSKFELEKAVYNLDPNADDGKMEFEADGWGVGVNLGVLYELSERTRFGIVYRSKVSTDVEDKPDFSGLTEERRELLNQFGALNRDISFETSTPQMVTAGAYHDLNNGWSFSLDLVWVDFSDWGFEDVEVGDVKVSKSPGKYKDIWVEVLSASTIF